MTSSIITTLQNYYTVNQQNQDTQKRYYTLLWRRGQLLVKPVEKCKQPYLYVLNEQESLVKCLQHSPVNLVRIDPKLGEAKVRFWADSCKQAYKPIYLRIPVDKNIPKTHGLLLLRWLKRLTEWLTALILMLIFSPLMLGLILLIQLDSPESLFSREWHVGERGKLFRKFQFCITPVNKTNLGYHRSRIMVLQPWITKYGLEKLPQLLNVLRGEMSLFGPHCWCLQSAVRLSPEKQRQLNKLPGIIGLWQFKAQSEILSLDNQNLTTFIPSKQ
ncbi:MAG: sugar transferase [Nostocaceae cyanobacterium]|nr:sugar transferase [Nostocaceae cyanobacterium]